jgi:hypothetical protein
LPTRNEDFPAPLRENRKIWVEVEGGWKEGGRPNGGRAFTSQSRRLKTLLFWRSPLFR